MSCLDDLLAVQRKEKKDLVAKTQKLKYGVPKGDKKKKREVTAEIAQLLADLESKHQNEVKEFEKNMCRPGDTEQKSEVLSKHDIETSRVASKKKLQTGKKRVSEKPEKSKSEIAPKLSKAQKKRNKKAMLQKERNDAIAAQEMENLNSLRNLESEEINKKLSERHLTIHEIPSDGHCLYKAIEHQLSFLNLQKMSMKLLRESTSKHMLAHMEDFIPFLTCPETGDVLTKDQYVKYCEDIAKTSAWGGHTEIQALSHVCEVPIEIIQAKGPSIFAGDEKSNPKLILSYHRHVYGLGEHYNSVIPVAE